MSRHQCEIFAVTFDRDSYKAPTIYVRDRQSTNGTLVIRKDVPYEIGAENGLEPSAWLLERGSQIHFGRYMIEVVHRYKAPKPDGLLRFQVSEIEVSCSFLSQVFALLEPSSPNRNVAPLVSAANIYLAICP